MLLLCALIVGSNVVWGGENDPIEVIISYADIPDGFTATTGTSGSINKTVKISNDLTIQYAGINTKSSATAADHAYGYAMFLKNYGFVYNSTAPSGYYPSKVTIKFGSNTGISGKAGINFGTAALTTRNSSVTGSVTKSGTCELTNSDQTKLYWNFSTTGANVQVDNIKVVYTKMSASPLTTSDLALTDAPIALNFDLYNNVTPQVINYTTSSTGAVTIANNSYATFSINETNKTITVTPTAVTPSAQTITVNQAADATYAAGSATFTLSVSNSAPVITASDVILESSATSGTITYSISNPVEETTLTATKEEDWINSVVVDSEHSKVTFVSTANESYAQRTGTITLTYGADLATKSVSIKQKGMTPLGDKSEWNLATNSYASANENNISWTSACATMRNSKGSGSNVNNYIPPTQSSTRFYSGNTLTITPISGYKINGVVFTATTEGYASTLSGSTWTNATAYLSETMVTVIPTSGTSNISAAIGGTCGFTKVEVYYELLPIPSVAPNSTSINATIEETDGTIAITYYNITEVVAEINFFESDGSTPADDPTWLSAEIDNEKNVYYFIGANTGAARTAYLKVHAFDDELNDVYSPLITITQAGVDYATLPFLWEGGASAELLAKPGVTASGLGSDYAEANAPYLIKLDGTGDYITIKTNASIGYCELGVKMLGGASTSKISVQESSDGNTFTDIQVLTISGSSNDELTLKTSVAFTSTSRYIRLYFTKGSNVGVGPISIYPTSVSGTISPAGWSSFSSTFPLDLSTISGGTAYVASEASGPVVTLAPCTNVVAANTGLMVKGKANAEFTINVSSAALTTPSATNLLKGQATTSNVAASGTDGKYHYVFGYESSSVYGFYNLLADTEVSAGKAYLETTTALTAQNAPAIIRILDEENNATSTERIDGKNDAIKFIENGHIYILREGVVYDALGRKVR